MFTFFVCSAIFVEYYLFKYNAFQLYKSWITNQCTEKVKCDIQKGYPDFEHTKVSCHANAYCGRLNGVPSCICSNGYVGDGVKSCDPVKYKCKNGQCNT